MGFLSKIFGSKSSSNSDINSPAGAQVSDRVKIAFSRLSSSAQEQSAAVQQTMASIEEMRSMLSQTDRHVTHSLSLAQKAAEDGENRLKTVEKMQNAMTAIKDSNVLLADLQTIFAAIKNKTRVINDIVFKTQLLSFNASIEAARAGHFGKGFSVVAEEVGRLAQTSGKASKEIETLILESQQKATSVVTEVIARAHEGANVSTEAMVSFQDVTRVISEIAKSLNAMSEASREQLQGMEQTTTAIEKINRLADENRRSAENILRMSDDSTTLSKIDFAKTPSMHESSKSKAPSADVLHLVSNVPLKPAVTPLPPQELKSISADDDSFKPQR